MDVSWNPWHGCHKLSPGCKNCYVYRGDAWRGRDASNVEKTQNFYLPIAHRRDGCYKYAAGTLFSTCFTSDFLVPDADGWRAEAWRMMKARSDCRFFFITKRIDRFSACVPGDWGAGYPNVMIGCTMEDQTRVDERLPIFLAAPIFHKTIILEPLLGPIDFGPRLTTAAVRQVVVGGESGENARVCNYDWVLSIREQCLSAGISFYFRQTGANFFMDGKLYRIPRQLQHAQARKAGINLPKERGLTSAF